MSHILFWSLRRTEGANFKILILFAVSALQVIQQSTGLDLGWQEDPCSPKSWEHIECEGNLVTSLYDRIALEFFESFFLNLIPCYQVP